MYRYIYFEYMYIYNVYVSKPWKNIFGINSWNYIFFKEKTKSFRISNCGHILLNHDTGRKGIKKNLFPKIQFVIGISFAIFAHAILPVLKRFWLSCFLGGG